MIHNPYPNILGGIPIPANTPENRAAIAAEKERLKIAKGWVCSSCANGDYPVTVATLRILKAPKECTDTHGTLICEEHAEIVLSDYPEAVTQELETP